MIYYIVGIQANHDETVLSTHDNADIATQYVELYRQAPAMTELYKEFRIDTVPSAEEIRVRNAAIPADPNRDMSRESLNDWRRNAPYPVEESTGDFTLAELFGNNAQLPPMSAFGNTEWLVCRECGALVGVPQRHVDFHNKLLP